MQIVKDIEKIQAQLQSTKPLWLCLKSDVVSQMAIGWICNLAKNNMIGLPSEKDLKNHEFMIVNKSVEEAIKKENK